MVMVPTDGEDHGSSYCYSGESSPSSDATTNWQIAHGSLESAVTFESSDSPIDPDSIPKSAVIVKPPSLDSGPCEIKICFAQRHEIQQIYIRSTARVYEIYYASSLHGENVYLCTVRCCVAERDGEILLAGIEDASKQHMEVVKGGPAMEKFTGKGKTGSNGEEEWVDVEVSDLPVVENGINCSVKQAAKEGGRSSQELYEATAQISDAEPCASLTIRLLSLQSKDCLYIDEVYIFGDPSVSTDSENHSIPVESSAQSSLMAMLVPTLLQLSKSGSSRTNDKYSSDRQRKDDEVGPTSRGPDMTDDMNGIHCKQRSTVDEEHMSLHADNQLASGPVQSLLPTMDLNKKEQVVGNGQKPQSPKQLTADEKNSMPDIERVLGQLVDRVNRIEDICLRFEETMLKPINGMEVRLQRVEEQLEILAKNSQNTGLPCNRISAPSFSCTDSNFGSFYTDGNDHPPNLASELKVDFPDDKLASQIDNSSITISSPHMLPSLVITAPEFSCGEEEEEEDNHVLEPLKNSPEVKKNLAASIDDALAAALSGFLSTSVISPAECTQNFEVTTSEHSGEIHEDGKPLECSPSSPLLRNDCIRDEKNEDVPSKYRRALTVKAPEFNLEDLDDAHSPRTQNKSITDSVSTSSDITILPDEGQKLSDKHAKASEVVDDFKDESCARESNEANDLANPVDHVNILFSENNHTKSPPRDQTETNPETLGSAGEGVEDDASELSSKYKLGGCYSVPSLDFEIPILEVKFGLHDDSGTMLPLEVLLGDTAGICSENDTETNITVVDDDVGRDPLTNNDSLVDYTCANVDDGPSHPCADPGSAFVSLL